MTACSKGGESPAIIITASRQREFVLKETILWNRYRQWDQKVFRLEFAFQMQRATTPIRTVTSRAILMAVPFRPLTFSSPSPNL